MSKTLTVLFSGSYQKPSPILCNEPVELRVLLIVRVSLYCLLSALCTHLIYANQSQLLAPPRNHPSKRNPNLVDGPRVLLQAVVEHSPRDTPNDTVSTVGACPKTMLYTNYLPTKYHVWTLKRKMRGCGFLCSRTPAGVRYGPRFSKVNCNVSAPVN